MASSGDSDVKEGNLKMPMMWDGTKENWERYKDTVEATAIVANMYEVLEPDAVEPMDPAGKNRWKKATQGVYARLVLSLTGTPLGIVKKHKKNRDGHKAWKDLLEKYDHVGEVKMDALVTELITLSMADFKDPLGYFLRCEEIQEELKPMGVTIDDVLLKCLAMTRLGDEYKQLRTTLDALKGMNIGYEGLKDRVKDFYMRNEADVKKETDSGSALYVDLSIFCSKCKNRGHPRKECKMGKGSKGFKGYCHKCGKFGHMRADCKSVVDAKKEPDNKAYTCL